MSFHSEPVQAPKRCMAQSITLRFLRSFETSFNAADRVAVDQTIKKKTHPRWVGLLLNSSGEPLFAKQRNKNKWRWIGKIWRRAFFWRAFGNFLSLLASTEILRVFAIDCT